MAITIQAQLAKKIGIENIPYSSHQASISISAEVADLNQVVAEAQRLYALAEQAVDAQLSPKVHSVHPQGIPAQPATPTASYPQPAAPAPRAASRPYNNNGQTRRGPAPATDSQLRFLDKLIRDSGTDPNAILHQHQIGSLRDLSCKAAAGLIDELKGAGARS